MIGTDRYMAPEQLADGKITAATDVYACGVVADQALPGDSAPRDARDHRPLPARGPEGALPRRERAWQGLREGGRRASGDRGPSRAPALRPGPSARPPSCRPRGAPTPTSGRAGGSPTSERGRVLHSRLAGRRAADRRRGPRGRVAAAPAPRAARRRSGSPAGQAAAVSGGSISSSGDPAQQARALAEYLRQQAR